MDKTGIYAAMADAMAEITAIGKDKAVAGMGWKFRGIDDVYNAINPILGRHGITCCPMAGEPCRERLGNGRMELVTLPMTYRFYHRDGSYMEASTIGEAMDNSDKAMNKAMSMAHKYCLLQVFCIPTEDMAEADCVAENREAVERGRKMEAKPAPKPADARAGSGKRQPVKPEQARPAPVQARKPMDESMGPDDFETPPVEAYDDEPMAQPRRREEVDRGYSNQVFRMLQERVGGDPTKVVVEASRILGKKVTLLSDLGYGELAAIRRELESA